MRLRFILHAKNSPARNAQAPARRNV
jgi:hypothetical protein